MKIGFCSVNNGKGFCWKNRLIHASQFHCCITFSTKSERIICNYEQIASPLLWCFLSKKGVIERMSNNKISVPYLGDGEIVPSTAYQELCMDRFMKLWDDRDRKKTFNTVLDKTKSGKRAAII